MGNIEFNAGKLSKLKKQYKSAKDGGKDTFMFEGHELDVGYAKYLIEYLETQFGKGGRA